MREFFRGWRRKVGGVTLGLACVFITGWVRSYSASDVLRVAKIDTTIHLVRSVRDSLVWEAFDGFDPRFTPNPKVWSSGDALSLDDHRILQRAFQKGRQRFRWNGFAVITFTGKDNRTGSQTPSIIRTTYWIFPYWSLVIPLTLLSAWLLLSKPRPSAPKSTEPAPPPGSDHA